MSTVAVRLKPDPNLAVVPQSVAPSTHVPPTELYGYKTGRIYPHQPEISTLHPDYLGQVWME